MRVEPYSLRTRWARRDLPSIYGTFTLHCPPIELRNTRAHLSAPIALPPRAALPAWLHVHAFTVFTYTHLSYRTINRLEQPGTALTLSIYLELMCQREVPCGIVFLTHLGHARAPRSPT